MYLEQEKPPQGLSGMDPLPQQFNGGNESQSALRLDDGTGLRVVNARFVGERQFDWDLFAGCGCSPTPPASRLLSRMLDNTPSVILSVCSGTKAH